MTKSMNQFAPGVVFVLLSGCAHFKPPHADRHSLAVASRVLPVVQHTHEADKRSDNPLYLANRRLREEEFGSQALQVLVESMYATMQDKSGIGIAANQVGKNLQVFMIEAKPGNSRYQVLGPVPFGIFINPRIVQASAERRSFWHGCLSAVGEKRGNVAAYEWIEIEAHDQSGQPLRTRLEGLAAVIFQHEFRHMLGGTYLDRARDFLEKTEIDRRIDQKELTFFGIADADMPLLTGDYQIGETLDAFYLRQGML